MCVSEIALDMALDKIPVITGQWLIGAGVEVIAERANNERNNDSRDDVANAHSISLLM
jgi:hypothetical protein